MLFPPSSVARVPLFSFLLFSSPLLSLLLLLLFSCRHDASSGSRVKSSEETLIGSDFSLFPLVSAFHPCPLVLPLPPPFLPTLPYPPYVPREPAGLRFECPRKYFRVDTPPERNLATGFLHLFPAASSFISRPPTGRLTPAATLSLSDLRVRLVFDREILRRFILFLFLAARYPFADPRLYTCQNATCTILRYSRKVFFFREARVQ